MSDLAQERAENMIQARNRHFVELVNKKNFYAQKKMMTDMQRAECTKQREENKAAVKSARFEAMSSNFLRKDDILTTNNLTKEQQDSHDQKAVEQRKIVRLQALIAK